MVFQNGNAQTIYIGQLEGIRVNATGNVLYYTVTGPDGNVYTVTDSIVQM